MSVSNAESPMNLLQSCTVFLKALGLNFIDRHSVDCKEAALRFVMNNEKYKAVHHYSYVEETLEKYGKPLFCKFHNSKCVVGTHELGQQVPSCAHVFVAGPPCSPYSLQRGDRSMRRHQLCIMLVVQPPLLPLNTMQQGHISVPLEDACLISECHQVGFVFNTCRDTRFCREKRDTTHALPCLFLPDGPSTLISRRCLRL